MIANLTSYPSKQTHRWFGFWSLFIGLTLFYFVLGYNILNPLYDTWLLRGDSAQHYLGWVFYRNSPWQWPLFTIEGFGFPEKSSLIYTDCIPLLAIPFKLIRDWLPATFQYLGIWQALCFVLNVYWAMRLLDAHRLPLLQTIIASTFFAMLPMLILRTYGHESLEAQWLIIASLWAHCTNRSRLTWLTFILLSIWIHPYFVIMVGAIYIGDRWAYYSKNNTLSNIKWDTLIAFVALINMYIAGYFPKGKKQLAAVGYPNYSANLLTWFDPMDWHQFLNHFNRHDPLAANWSVFTPALQQHHADQYEGFAYLGAGLLALLCITLVKRLFARINNKQTSSITLIRQPVWVLLIIMGIYSLSTTITWGSIALMEIPLNETAIKLLSIFRACGRFVWPLSYALVIWIIVASYQHFSLKQFQKILLIAVTLQIIDLSPKFNELNRFFSEIKKPPHWVDNALWDQTLHQKNMMIVLDDFTFNDDWIWVAKVASQHHQQTNAAIISRIDETSYHLWRNQQINAVKTNQLEQGTVYLSTTPINTATKNLIIGPWYVYTH